MRSPAEIKHDEAVALEEKVALLTTERWSQAAIADFLGLSQSTVSRLLASAEKRGSLVRLARLDLPEERVRQIREELRQHEHLKELKERLIRRHGGKHLLSVDIVPSFVGERDDEADPWEAKCQQFGRRSSGLVVDYLSQSRLVGVSYGRTLASVVEGLGDISPSLLGQNRHVRFFPTWTEPYEDASYKFQSKLFPNPAELSSTRLAKAFARALSENDKNVPSLNCFPSLLPLDDTFNDNELKVIRRFYHSNGSYRDVFEEPANGKPGGLIYQMDAAIVGIGVTAPQGQKANPNWHVSKTVIESAGFDEKQHEKAYIGDIGGVWLKKPSPDAKGKRAAKASQDYIDRIADRWMGVNFKHLKKCVDAAAETGRVGVIALAVGQERSEAVLEALRLSLVSRLVIDSELAAKLDG